MNIVRLIAYLVALGLIAFADLSTIQANILFYIYLGSLYIESKDNNIRSLIFLLVVVQTFFYHADVFLYVLSRYYWETGSELTAA